MYQTTLVFKKKYQTFYGLRYNDHNFKDMYFDFMEQKKRIGVSFDVTLQYFLDKCGRVEASFSSKLVATIDPKIPIWDFNVLRSLGLKAPYTYCKDRIVKTIIIYNKICDHYRELFKTGEADAYLKEFDRIFKNVDISDTKKIDFMIWAKNVIQK